MSEYNAHPQLARTIFIRGLLLSTQDPICTPAVLQHQAGAAPAAAARAKTPTPSRVSPP